MQIALGADFLRKTAIALLYIYFHTFLPRPESARAQRARRAALTLTRRHPTLRRAIFLHFWGARGHNDDSENPCKMTYSRFAFASRPCSSCEHTAMRRDWASGAGHGGGAAGRHGERDEFELARWPHTFVEGGMARAPPPGRRVAGAAPDTKSAFGRSHSMGEAESQLVAADQTAQQRGRRGCGQ